MLPCGRSPTMSLVHWRLACLWRRHAEDESAQPFPSAASILTPSALKKMLKAVWPLDLNCPVSLWPHAHVGPAQKTGGLTEKQKQRNKAMPSRAREPVSYTHLTLPTIYSV